MDNGTTAKKDNTTTTTNDNEPRKKYSMRTERVELYPKYPKYKLEDVEVAPPRPKRTRLKDKPPVEIDLTDDHEEPSTTGIVKPTVVLREPAFTLPSQISSAKISPKVVLKKNINGIVKKAKMKHTSAGQNGKINIIQNNGGIEKAKTKFSSRISPSIGTVSVPSIKGELIAHKTKSKNKSMTNGKAGTQRSNNKKGKKYYFRTGERVPEYERLVKMGKDPPCFMKAYINDDIRYGVFPTRKFEKNEILLEYKGQLVTMEEAQELHKHYASTGQGCYIVDFQHNGQHMCVDATEADCYGRYVNDAVQRYANCEIKKYVVNDVPHLFLVAKREIPKLEELRYDYGDTKNITWRHIAKNGKPFNLNTLWCNNGNGNDKDDVNSEGSDEDEESGGEEESGVDEENKIVNNSVATTSNTTAVDKPLDEPVSIPVEKTAHTADPLVKLVNGSISESVSKLSGTPIEETTMPVTVDSVNGNSKSMNVDEPETDSSVSVTIVEPMETTEPENNPTKDYVVSSSLTEPYPAECVIGLESESVVASESTINGLIETQVVVEPVDSQMVERLGTPIEPVVDNSEILENMETMGSVVVLVVSPVEDEPERNPLLVVDPSVGMPAITEHLNGLVSEPMGTLIDVPAVISEPMGTPIELPTVVSEPVKEIEVSS